MKHKLLLAALLCATHLPAIAHAQQDSLRLVLASPTQTLDPQRTSSVLSGALLRSAFEQLTRVNTQGAIEPLLAESWEVEEGGLSWLVHLRQGVTFHDGTPFNAEAVVANFTHVLDVSKPNPSRTNLGSLTGAEAVDEHTVRLRTSKPFSGLPIALSHTAASMISPKSIADGSLESGNQIIAGTGPFKLSKFNLPDEVDFERNDNYWGEAAKLQRIEARSRSDDQTRLAAFLSGEADLDLYLTPESRARAEGDPNIEITTLPSIRLFILHLPMGLPEMEDQRVRRALNLAIDRNQIIETLYQGTARPADNAMGPGVFGYEALEPYGYDPAGASALLAEAGWEKNEAGVLMRDGKPFPTIPLLASRGRQPGDARLAQIIAGYLQEIGVPTSLQIDEFATFFAAAQAESKVGGKFVQMAWGFPQMDGAALLCSVYLPGNAYNFGNYQNAAVTDACATLNEAFDPEERARLIADTVKMVYEDAPAVFLVSPSYLVGQRKGLAGLALSSGEGHIFSGAYWK